MDKLKQWVALTVVAVLALAAGGWFLLISPKRGEAADLRLQAEQQVGTNNALQQKITLLKAQAKDLPKQQARLAAVAAKIPDNPALPALIRALTDAADEAGVELVSLAPATPVAVVAPAAGTATVTPTTTGNAATAQATGAQAAALSTGAAAPAAATAGTLQSISVALNVVGGYFQVEQFLDRVEGLSRAMKVGNLSLAPGSNPVKPPVEGQEVDTDSGKVLTATITANVYLATGRATTTDATIGK